MLSRSVGAMGRGLEIDDFVDGGSFRSAGRVATYVRCCLVFLISLLRSGRIVAREPATIPAPNSVVDHIEMLTEE